MTQDELYELGIRAGFMDWELDDGTTRSFDPRYIRFAKLVAAKEREALLDTVYSYAKSLSWNEDFQADIRARGEA